MICREIKKDEQLYVSIQIRECVFIIPELFMKI